MLRWRNRVWSRKVAALSEGLRYATEVVPRVRVLSGRRRREGPRHFTKGALLLTL